MTDTLVAPPAVALRPPHRGKASRHATAGAAPSGSPLSALSTRAATPPFPASSSWRTGRSRWSAAGPVAASKLRALLDAGARVTVVAPEVRARSRERRGHPPTPLSGLGPRRRVARGGGGAAGRQPRGRAGRGRTTDVRQRGGRSAECKPLSRRGGPAGGVTAAISTDGRAPALAGLIREAIEALLPEDEVERWLAAAAEERAGWLAGQVPMETAAAVAPAGAGRPLRRSDGDRERPESVPEVEVSRQRNFQRDRKVAQELAP